MAQHIVQETVVSTGASGGIGTATALRLAARGTIMTSLSRTYPDNTATSVEPRTRWGGPRRRRPTTTRYERYEQHLIDRPYGSHMPLDTSVHWNWRNPLNILPALVLFVVLLALVGLVLA